MNENGIYKTIEGPAEKFGVNAIENYIRYSPRQVRLNPNEKQTIRLMMRRSNSMKEGEYRSHLMFSPIPDPDSTESLLNG